MFAYLNDRVASVPVMRGPPENSFPLRQIPEDETPE
jgi:hypothetical protein